MSDNKAIIERFEQAFAENDTGTIDELCSPGLVDHNPVPPNPPTLDGLKAAIAGYTSAFPDLAISGLQVIGEGDMVATHWTASGTHQGDMPGIPATGKRISVEGMNLYRLVDGRITEVWTQFDGVSMLQQLGVMPAPEAGDAV
jgi:steroid delta-isomerase-like uncharacterized protein